MLKHQWFVNCVFFSFCRSVVRFVLKCVEMVWNGRFFALFTVHENQVRYTLKKVKIYENRKVMCKFAFY